MLGLGNGIVTSNTLKQPFFSYYSNFTSDTDNWVQDSVQGDDWTLTANQTIAGESGWVKVEVTDTQTNLSGIKNPMFTGLTDIGGDYLVYRYRIYLYDNGNNWWESTDDVTVYTASNLSPTAGITAGVPLDEDTVLGPITLGPDGDGIYADNFYVWFSDITDNPQAGAIFYVKDISVQLYRAD